MYGTLHEKMTAVLEQDLGVVVDNPSLNLFESGVLDSLSFVNLLLYIEAEFGVRVSFEELDMDHFSSINGICDYISEQTADRVVTLPGKEP